MTKKNENYQNLEKNLPDARIYVKKPSKCWTIGKTPENYDPKKLTKILAELDTFLLPGTVEIEGTKLIIHPEFTDEPLVFADLEIKENIILRYLYMRWNLQISSENIGLTITSEDDIWGEIDLIELFE